VHQYENGAEIRKRPPSKPLNNSPYELPPWNTCKLPTFATYLPPNPVEMPPRQTKEVRIAKAIDTLDDGKFETTTEAARASSVNY
jgi:hypothetical protein